MKSSSGSYIVVGKGEGEMCDSCCCSSQMLEISHLIVNNVSQLLHAHVQ